MNREEELDHIRDMINNGNYLGAGRRILNLHEGEPERDDLLGEMAMAAVDELNNLSPRSNGEKIYYLRSVLAWIFREVPGLSFLYRDQLKYSNPGIESVFDFFKKRTHFPSSPEDAVETVKETVENIKQTVDDASEKISKEDIRKTTDDILQQAEKGIKDGVNMVSDFLKSMDKKEGDEEKK